MKKILILTAFSALFFSCANTEKETSIDTLISSQNLKLIKERRIALQAEISKLDDAIASLDIKKEETLVSVKTVKDTVFTHYLEIQGNIDTKENILIQPEVPGTLVSLNVKAGQKVSKGQILGRIDDGGGSQQLASLENQYAFAKTAFERQRNLWNQKIGSEIQFLNAQTQMISAQKAVAQVRAQLSKTSIKAPFSGTIDEVFVEKGEVVAPNPRGLMRIVNLGNMYVSTTVPEMYSSKLKVGAPVVVFISSLNKNYVGKIRQIGNFINPDNRSFGIEVSVPNAENLLLPNQVAKLKIIDYTNADVIVVPTNVIQEDGEGNKFIFTVINTKGKTGTAKKVLVKTGKSSNNSTEIISGLHSNDVIVTEGVNTISDGMKLNF